MQFQGSKRQKSHEVRWKTRLLIPILKDPNWPAKKFRFCWMGLEEFLNPPQKWVHRVSHYKQLNKLLFNEHTRSNKRKEMMNYISLLGSWDFWPENFQVLKNTKGQEGRMLPQGAPKRVSWLLGESLLPPLFSERQRGLTRLPKTSDTEQRRSSFSAD